ncbi:MAG: hypothetical protein HDS12_02080 [Bacteroides sp.]|nr:hypothetical protein [Bacteroides sp.]
MKKLILSLLLSLLAIGGTGTAQTVTVTTPYFSTSYSNDRGDRYYCSGYYHDHHHHRHHNPRKCKACKKARKAWEKAHKHHHKAYKHFAKRGKHHGHHGH